jgi:hypothetical protein
VAISFPLDLPATRAPARIDWRREANVGSSESPFSFSPQTYVWSAERWLAMLTWGTMGQADADDVEAFLLALNGREGSFLLGDFLRTAPRGTWAGQSPLVNGASQVGRTLAIDGLTPTTTTGKAGDWFQLGSGATSRLYRLTAPFTANGSGQATLDFWPGLRGSPADNAPLTLASTRGLFMLASNVSGWTQEDVRESGISLDCVEDLRGL